MCLNMGTGTLDEGIIQSLLMLSTADHLALGWVDYCNGTRDTYYANLRRKNGRQEPYNV